MTLKKTSIALIIISMLSLTQTFGQTNNSVELKKIGSSLIECFYVVKTQSAIVLSGECTTVINQRISNLANALSTKINNNKAALTQKLGSENFQELENQVKNYLQFAEKMETAITKEERGSMMMWINLSKSKVEELFIKLNK